MKDTEKHNKKTWWQKQSSAMKTTIVAGTFALFAALCGVCGTITATIIAHNLNQERINVSMNAGREIMGRGDMLFARNHLNLNDDLYELSTSTCIEFQMKIGPMIFG